MLATRVVLRPLSNVFKSDERATLSRQALIGKVCRVRTGSVDGCFGQAVLVARGGAELVLTIRCDEPNGLGRGHEALVIGFDEARRAYLVEPMEQLLGARDDGALAGETALDFNETQEATQREVVLQEEASVARKG